MSALLVAAFLLSLAAAPALPLPDGDAAALQPFLNGVAQYVALHHRVATSITPVALPTDAVNLSVMPTALRGRLRRARAGTQEGQIFAPRAAVIFKRLIAQTVQGDYAALMRATHEDPDELGRALVNDRWPGTALTTMPPDLLAVFPPLPSELEYRFVHPLVSYGCRSFAHALSERSESKGGSVAALPRADRGDTNNSAGHGQHPAVAILSGANA